MSSHGGGRPSHDFPVCSVKLEVVNRNLIGVTDCSADGVLTYTEAKRGDVESSIFRVTGSKAKIRLYQQGLGNRLHGEKITHELANNPAPNTKMVIQAAKTKVFERFCCMRADRAYKPWLLTHARKAKNFHSEEAYLL